MAIPLWSIILLCKILKVEYRMARHENAGMVYAERLYLFILGGSVADQLVKLGQVCL